MTPFWHNFDFMTPQVLLNFQILENDGILNFSPQKLSVVVWSRYIALELL